ncbi:hypothetical protein COF68_06265 [Bacillus toyonensis]|nr:hypothetical protein COF68_06265 [Bacillus toyonensis]
MLSTGFTTEQIIIFSLYGIQLVILGSMLKEVKKSNESKDKLKHNKLLPYSLLALVTVWFQIYPQKIVYVLNQYSYHVSKIVDALNNL